MELFPHKSEKTKLQRALEVDAAGYGGCAAEDFDCNYTSKGPKPEEAPPRPLFTGVKEPGTIFHVDLRRAWAKP